MKVFWSWQSDTPGRIGRHFVRDAIQEAIDRLREEQVELDEPERDLHLDHDRKGVSGSPDLAETILDKIRDSSVFIADVTPVGKTCDKKNKAILNPNVAIELGYALAPANAGDNRLLMVLNGFYGDRESLPFDLRHKAGPIIYNLKPDATKEQLAQARQSLVSDLKKAIGACIATSTAKDAAATPGHIEASCQADCSVYFEYGEPLDKRQIQGKEVAIVYNCCPLLYLRLIPVNHVPDLRRSEAKEIVYGIKIQPLRQCVGGGADWGLNQYGAITYSFTVEDEGANLLTSSQVFLNREIWGLDATRLAGKKLIPSIRVEELYEAGLKHYLEVAQNLLELAPPFEVEAGASNIAGYRMALGERHYTGPVFDDEIKCRKKLRSFDAKEVNQVLLSIFEDFFDAFGEKRPENFRGFPVSES